MTQIEHKQYSESPDQFWKGIMTVLSGMLIQAILGCVPIWGNIVVYVTSYFRIYDDTITLQNTFMVFPLTLCMGALSMQLGSYLLDFWHPKLQLLVGGSIFAVAFMLSSYMTNLYLFVLFYSLVSGIGYGLIYILPLKNAWLFFPNNKGMIGGIILASHSFAAIGWTFFTSSMINPDNDMPNLYLNVGNSLEVLFSPDSKVANNVDETIRVVSYCLCFMVAAAVILMQKKQIQTFDQELAQELLQKGIVHDSGVNDHQAAGYNRQDSFQTYTSSDNGSTGFRDDISYSSRGSNMSGYSDLSHMTLQESVKDKTFWHIFVMLTLSMSYCYFIKVVFKNFGNIQFNDDAFLTQVAGTSFFCGASARFAWGTIQDYIGFKKVYATILFFLTLLSFTLVEIAHSKILYQTWIGLTFAMEGGHFSIFPALAANIYGAQLGSKVYSLLFIGTAIASLLSLLVANIVLPMFGWNVVFMIFAFLNLLSLFLLFLFDSNPAAKIIPRYDERPLYSQSQASRSQYSKSNRR